MAGKEHPERYNCWLNELDFLADRVSIRSAPIASSGDNVYMA
jgi:hypothetical protein